MEVDHDGHQIKFDLTVAADRIAGEATGSDANETLKATLDVKVVKELLTIKTYSRSKKPSG